MSDPHVHDPAGPGEYCIECCRQAVVWARHDERSSIINLVDEWARQFTAAAPVGQQRWIPATATKVLLRWIEKGWADD